MQYLRRCVELAAEALEAGDEPFGSVLVAADGIVVFEDRNRVASGDRTRHPEFEIARWAAANMTLEARAAATVYTSGEVRCVPQRTDGSGSVGSCTSAPPSN
jgi:tRNA(Arg) A34 adenosine deaminase TadA